jgi:hypothetical protein
LLFEEVVLGAPTGIGFDCADFYLEFGASGVSLATHDFVVPLWSETEAPGERLSFWLSQSLRYGTLVDVRDERVDDGAEVKQEVVFVMDGPEGVEEMRVSLGSKGQPVHLELIHSPGTPVWGSYPHGDKLQALVAKSAIAKLSFPASNELLEETSPTVLIEFDDSSQFKVRLEELEQEAEGFCGC